MIFMRRTILFLLLLLGLGAHLEAALPVVNRGSIDCTTFKKAVPVWAQGRESEKCLMLFFRQVVWAGDTRGAKIRLTCSADYRLTVNGKFVAHGPCVAAHGFYRIDEYDLSGALRKGDNVVGIEVTGYNDPNYYLLAQPSFLQAEIETDGKVCAATGTDFECYDLKLRKQNVEKFSFQRPSTEYYFLDAHSADWAMDTHFKADSCRVFLEPTAPKSLIGRGVPYPDYTVHEAVRTKDSVYKFKGNSTGFIGARVTVSEPTTLVIRFDELADSTGHPTYTRLGVKPFVTWELQPGTYDLESFEPYTMQYAEIVTPKGSCKVERVYMRDYCNSDVHRGQFNCDNSRLNRLFEVARETLRQSSLDIFMDCPSRERAGWLCDSYFAARVAFDLSGNTRLEHNFLQNFLLPRDFPDIDKGMLPMCYPSDHQNHNYIPNWAMFFVLELEEYYQRSGDLQTVLQARQKVYGLLDYFKPYINSDGLLEKLPKWVFVEWSDAAKYVQDVNYPTNALYAGMLDAAARLYGDSQLHSQAERVREAIRKQAFNGQFFCDNAVRKGGRLVPQTANTTEACQYYLFYFGVATPSTYPELWKKLRDEFGPERQQHNAYPQVSFANAFIGNYLRLELLSREGLPRQLVSETIAGYEKMADLTGTLWENMTPTASCCHGFASHLIHVYFRDLLGLYKIDPVRKVVTLRFVDSGLSHCEGVVPVGNEEIKLEWQFKNGKRDYKLCLPTGWTSRVI